MPRRPLPLRRTPLADAGERERTRAFWAAIAPVERFALVFAISEEAHALVGKLPPDPAGRPRSAARVHRP